MTNEELELQALEAELAALEEPTKTEEVAEVIELKAPKSRKKLRRAKTEEAPAPAAPTPPAPVAAPMPEPEVAIAPPIVRKTKDVRPLKAQGNSSRGIRNRNF